MALFMTSNTFFIEHFIRTWGSFLFKI